MPNTRNLGLPLLAAGQAQKHVTHNEALTLLDALVQVAARDKDLAQPPPSPAEGDRYIVAPNPGGAWTGLAGRIVRFEDGVWAATEPRAGFLAYLTDEAALYLYDGAAWAPFRPRIDALDGLARLGIGTTADALVPFAAKLNAALWTARPRAEGGTGHLRYTLNKEAPADVLSLLLQSGYAGRAEIGLVGGDDLVLKVSADGAAWREALRVDRASGGIDFLAAETSLPAAATTDLGAAGSLLVAITGSGSIAAFGTRPRCLRLIRFAGAPALVHHATQLVLPGARSIAAAPGDTALATSDAAGNWRVRHYQRADGRALDARSARLAALLYG
ncbi:DUF2793 domain-containing protein [Methylobacterium sp. A54F]